MADGSLTKHGFPRGFRFMPTSLELISLLSDQIAHGGELPPAPHDRIFHNLQILNYHPDELYEMYREDAEDKYMYFFSRREYQQKQQRSPEDKERRPVRVARGGTWKPSGSAKMLKCGGFIAGRKVTLVFYDRGVDKTNWGMHEFLVPVDTRITSLAPNIKYPRFHDLALYRLYILRSSDMESDNNGSGSSSSHMNEYMMTANAMHGRHLPASTAVVSLCPPAQPLGIFAASPSHMPPMQQLLLHPSVVELEHAAHYNYYYHQELARPAMPPAAAAHQDPETAGQEAAHHFVDKRSPPPPPAAEEVDYDGPGMPDWNLDLAELNDPRLEFTMAEIMGIPGFDDEASLGC